MGIEFLPPERQIIKITNAQIKNKKMNEEFQAQTTDDSSTNADGNSVSPTCPKPIVSGSLPSLDDAAKVAVRISEEAINPPLSAQEQAFFIAGFQECIKWLRVWSCNDR